MRLCSCCTMAAPFSFFERCCMSVCAGRDRYYQGACCKPWRDRCSYLPSCEGAWMPDCAPHIPPRHSQQPSPRRSCALGACNVPSLHHTSLHTCLLCGVLVIACFEPVSFCLPRSLVLYTEVVEKQSTDGRAVHNCTSTRSDSTCW